MSDVVTNLLDALDEYTCSSSVVVTSTNPAFPHGTGVAVVYGGQRYILTAAHVLKGEPDNSQIRLIGRPDGPLQMLKGKEELARAIARGTHRQEYARATAVEITARLTNQDEDISALRIASAARSLPLTNFHDLGGQGKTETTAGTGISICGFPSELLTHNPQRGGRAAYPHITIQVIGDIDRAPNRLDPSASFISDFDYPKYTCDPHGLSGCGAWGVRTFPMGEIWAAEKVAQLLGIQLGHWQDANLLQFAKIERVLELLTADPLP